MQESRGLDMLAVGSDTLVLDRLLKYGSTFASKHVIHTQGDPLTATVCKDRHGSDAGFIEGDVDKWPFTLT